MNYDTLMKDNKIRNITRMLGIVFVMSLWACDLDEENPTGTTADVIWSTPEGFITAVNSGYYYMRSWYGLEDGLFMAESGTDLWYNAGKGTYSRQLSQYDGLSGTSGNFNISAWANLYKGINLCNAGIGRIDGAGFSSEAEKNIRLAELRFMRGFYYWHVVETWGDVILSTTETTSAEFTAERSSEEAFYELIISDLEFAKENLPSVDEWGEEYSRATNKAAAGFLARAYLSGAYHLTGTKQSEYFTKALEAAQDVIDNQATYGTALEENYADLWDPSLNNQQVLTGGEALLVASFAADPYLNYGWRGNRIHGTFLTKYNQRPALSVVEEYGYTNDARFMPTLALLDFFDETIDARYQASFREDYYATTEFTWDEENAETYEKDASVVGEAIAEGDLALRITKQDMSGESTLPYLAYDRSAVYNTDAGSSDYGSILTGNDYVAMIKFADPNRPSLTSQYGYNDVVIMRLAEMYMIAAEAELQLGNTSAAAEYINVIRERAALNDPSDMTITAADVTLDFILDERAREFAGEYMRWFDLKRTGTLVDRVHQYNPDITAIQDFHVKRPIPNTELQALLNGDEFGQNEGY